MSLSREDIKKIAHLARLDIQEKDIPIYERNLSNILNLVENLSQASTQSIHPMAHPLEGLTQRFRADEVTEHPDRDAFQKIAPQTEAGLYLVPQVIEN
ncbi:MAG: Asp-tRNA(Asn)/Glu-tRNA(Gln) amidotransferase subunit GatC [Gammaproteobacteria bacterium]